MSRQETVRRLWSVFEPELAEQGYELVEVEYVREGQHQVLRFFIDKASGGVTLDDCTAVSQLVSPLLDAGEYFGGQYLLEVSSPGLDRPLRKEADFIRFAGEQVRVIALTPTLGRHKFSGELKGCRDGLIVVACDGVSYEIHIENLKKANLIR